MTEGVIASLHELIDLRRFAQLTHYRTEGRAFRSGAHLSKVRGRGMDFSEVRNYQAGDEIRHMEWRVTARTGRPHVKIYQEEKERPVVLLVDFNPSMVFGTRRAFKSVVAARLAALLAWTVIKQGDRVGGFFFSALEHNEFIPRARDTGVLALLATLSDYTAKIINQRDERSRSLSDALLRMRRTIRPGSIVVLISDFYGMTPDCEQHLQRLRTHNDLLVYQIGDPLELAPPSKAQQYAITNGHQELLLDTRVSQVSATYVRYCQQRIITLSELFKRLQTQYVRVTADTDLAQLVRLTFPRRRSE